MPTFIWHLLNRVFHFSGDVRKVIIPMAIFPDFSSRYIIYDKDGNTVGAEKTFLEALKNSHQNGMLFTRILD